MYMYLVRDDPYYSYLSTFWHYHPHFSLQFNAFVTIIFLGT